MIGKRQDLRSAFRVRHKHGVRMGAARGLDFADLQTLVGGAKTFPDVADLVDMAGNITPQIAIRNQQHFVTIQRTNHIDCIGTGAADITLGLDRCA